MAANKGRQYEEFKYRTRGDKKLHSRQMRTLTHLTLDETNTRRLSCLEYISDGIRVSYSSLILCVVQSKADELIQGYGSLRDLASMN